MQTMEKHRQKSLLKALIMLGFVFSLYSLGIIGALLPTHIIINIAAAFMAGVALAEMFTLAHDATHNAFVKNRLLNLFFARLTMFFLLMSYSGWDEKHSRHHRGHNVKNIDTDWPALSKAEYDALPWLSKKMYALYRSRFGCLPYYLCDVWFKELIFSVDSMRRTGKKWAYVRDGLIVLASMVAQILILTYMGKALSPDRGVGQILLLSWIFPFLVSCFFIGLASYLQHTHPNIPRYTSRDTEGFVEKTIRGTYRVVFPQPLQFFMLNVNEHAAHHLYPTVPVYNLKKAQQIVEKQFDGKMSVIKNGFKGYVYATQRCKLYDFDNHCWTDFKGNATGPLLFDKNADFYATKIEKIA
jgi:omega-6 fatty acid desaturase (delta-12 desaturase)